MTVGPSSGPHWPAGHGPLPPGDDFDYEHDVIGIVCSIAVASLEGVISPSLAEFLA